MTSTKIVAYGTVDRWEFSDLDWQPIDRIPDPERQPYYARFHYQATIPTSDERFLKMFSMDDENSILTQEARVKVEHQMRQSLIDIGGCALLFSK